MKLSLAALVTVASMALTFTIACKKEHPAEGYRVVSYDAATHEWTILRNGTFDGTYMVKRLVVVCESYKWGEHETVMGPEACHLQVGRLIVPNTMPDEAHRSEFIDVFEMPGEVLSITEGDGPDRVMQQFKILKYDVVRQ